MSSTASKMFPLGTPPREDVVAAAELMGEYRARGMLTGERSEMMLRYVANPEAVLAHLATLPKAPAGSDGLDF